MLFIVPKANTATQYITYKEAQTMYGCGVSSARTIAGFSDPLGIFCRVPDSGTQITVARNIGLPETVLISPQCVPGSGTSNVIAGVMGFPTASQAIGFIAADAFDANRTTFNSLAFQSLGQTQAYLSDSGRTSATARTCATGTTRSGATSTSS